MTPNAEYILKIINHSKAHMTAEQIYQAFKEKYGKVAPATVYNNLSYLHKQGLIRKVSVEGCPDRYDHIRRHDHLVCERCGRLSDVTLEDLTEKLQKQISIPMLSYDLKISYICEECLKKGKDK